MKMNINIGKGKVVNFALGVLSVLFVITGCSQASKQAESYESRLASFQQDYETETGIDTMSRLIDSKKAVILAESPEAYELIAFYVADDSDEISTVTAQMEKGIQTSKVIYTQLKAEDECVVGIVITDEELIHKSESIRLYFADELVDRPYSIQQTLDEEEAQIITYRADGIREIKTIQLLNKQNQEIFTIGEEL